MSRQDPTVNSAHVWRGVRESNPGAKLVGGECSHHLAIPAAHLQRIIISSFGIFVLTIEIPLCMSIFSSPGQLLASGLTKNCENRYTLFKFISLRSKRFRRVFRPFEAFFVLWWRKKLRRAQAKNASNLRKALGNACYAGYKFIEQILRKYQHKHLYVLC